MMNNAGISHNFGRLFDEFLSVILAARLRPAVFGKVTVVVNRCPLPPLAAPPSSSDNCSSSDTRLLIRGFVESNNEFLSIIMDRQLDVLQSSSGSKSLPVSSSVQANLNDSSNSTENHSKQQQFAAITTAIIADTAVPSSSSCGDNNNPPANAVLAPTSIPVDTDVDAKTAAELLSLLISASQFTSCCDRIQSFLTVAAEKTQDRAGVLVKHGLLTSLADLVRKDGVHLTPQMLVILECISSIPSLRTKLYTSGIMTAVASEVTQPSVPEACVLSWWRLLSGVTFSDRDIAMELLEDLYHVLEQLDNWMQQHEENDAMYKLACNPFTKLCSLIGFLLHKEASARLEQTAFFANIFVLLKRFENTPRDVVIWNTVCDLCAPQALKAKLLQRGIVERIYERLDDDATSLDVKYAACGALGRLMNSNLELKRAVVNTGHLDGIANLLGLPC